MKKFSLFILGTCSFGLLTACGGGVATNTTASGTPVVSAGLQPYQLHLSVGGTKDLVLRSVGSSLALVIDCSQETEPDVVGDVISIASPNITPLNVNKVAGYYRIVTTPPVGDNVFTISGFDSDATCLVTATSAQNACADSMTFKSRSIGHAHVPVGADASTNWDAFPVSGDHWPLWAPWNRDYAAPVLPGYLVHNLEHGGVILSYKCVSATENADCAAAHANLVSIKSSFGKTRVLITPDPAQPSLYGVRTWRFGYSAPCYNETEILDFMTAHFAKGREDMDSDPPGVFDPTHL